MLVDDEEKVTVIDFPQMISTNHINAEYYFDRDVTCVRNFFKRRYGFVAEEWPSLTDDIGRGKGGKTLDEDLKASGWTEQYSTDFGRLMDIAEADEKEAEARGDIEEEEEDDDDDDDEEEGDWVESGDEEDEAEEADMEGVEAPARNANFRSGIYQKDASGVTVEAARNVDDDAFKRQSAGAGAADAEVARADDAAIGLEESDDPAQQRQAELNELAELAKLAELARISDEPGGNDGGGAAAAAAAAAQGTADTPDLTDARAGTGKEAAATPTLTEPTTVVADRGAPGAADVSGKGGRPVGDAARMVDLSAGGVALPGAAAAGSLSARRPGAAPSERGSVAGSVASARAGEAKLRIKQELKKGRAPVGKRAVNEGKNREMRKTKNSIKSELNGSSPW